MRGAQFDAGRAVPIGTTAAPSNAERSHADRHFDPYDIHPPGRLGEGANKRSHNAESCIALSIDANLSLHLRALNPACEILRHFACFKNVCAPVAGSAVHDDLGKGLVACNFAEA